MLSTQDTLSETKKPFILLRPFLAAWRWMFPPTVADRDRQSNTSRIIAGLTIVVLCLSAIAFTAYNGRAWHKSFKTLRSNQMVENSIKMEKSEKLLEALLEANNAFAKDPENPNAIRQLARYATMMKRNEARFLWTKLREVQAMTDDDLQWEIQALSNLNEDKSASDQIEKLLRDSKPTQKLAELADVVMQKLGRKKQLLELLSSHVEKLPDDHKIGLLLSRRQIEFGSHSEAAEGEDRLWKLAEAQDEIGLQAIEFLDKLKIQDSSRQKDLIRLLEKHPLSKEEHRIAALRRLAELEPERKQQIMDEAILARTKASREDLVPLARWLTLDGENEKLLTFLKGREDMVTNHTPLLQNYLNALTALKKYDELDRVLKDPKTRLTGAERAFHLVHLAFVTNKSWEEVNTLLLDAVSAAQSEAKPDMIMELAKYAEQRDHPLIAEQAFRAATFVRKKEQSAYEGLLRLTYKNGNSKGFMETAAETSRRWPDNQFFLERAIYSCLLAGIEVETSVTRAQKLLNARPSDSQRKLIMALAYSRQLDPKKAAQYLERINLSELSLGQGAVLCGIMHSAGFTAQAEKIAQQIPPDTPILPEEARFLQRARATSVQ
jgi:hypothetical protein